MSTPNFRTGAEAAKEASKRSFAARTPYLRLKDQEVDIIRLVDSPDNGWITVQMHQMVPTKGQPSNYKGDKWPDKMGAVCRNDKAFEGMYADCYICDYYVANEKLKAPSARTWALAVRRDEVTVDGQRTYVDKTRTEVTPAREAKDGQPALPEKSEEVKDIVILQYGYQNFFAALDGFFGAYESVTDRDYRVKRVGAGLDTDYQIVPLDPVVIEGLKFDTQHELFREDYTGHGIDLGAIVTEQSSDAYYARFFDHRISVSDAGEVSESDGAEAEAPKPSGDADNEQKLAALADRVRSYSASS